MKSKYKIIGSKLAKTELGSKAISLIELAKLNMTSYFILFTYNFLNETFKLEKDYFHPQEIPEIKKQLKKIDLSTVLAPYFSSLNKNKKYIVRSSYKYEDSKDLSFAGIFESFIAENINTIPETIIQVYSSMFSDKFLAYSSKVFTNIPLCMNIIIQEYIEPVKSGVVFTYKDKDIFYLEEALQKGKSVEKGDITPSQIIIANGIPYYVLTQHIRKYDNEIENDSLHYLIESIKKIPDYKKYSLDIEYLIDENKKIKILQYRAVTKELKLDDFYIYLFTVKNIGQNSNKIKTFIRQGFLSFFNKKIFQPLIKGNDIYIKFKDYSYIVNNVIKKIETNRDYHFKLYKLYLKTFSKFFNTNFSVNNIYAFMTYSFILIQINDKIDGYFGKILFFNLKVKEKNINAKSYYVSQTKGKKCIPSIINCSNKKKKNIKIKENIILMHDVFDYYYSKVTEILYRNKGNSQLLEFYTSPPIENKKFNKGSSLMQRPCFIYGKIFSKYGTPCTGTALAEQSIKPGNIKKDTILILETFSPCYVPHLFSAKAVITKEGGYLSHAAIVARELKKPAIGNVETDLIENGERVKIFKNGKIYLYGKK